MSDVLAAVITGDPADVNVLSRTTVPTLRAAKDALESGMKQISAASATPYRNDGYSDYLRAWMAVQTALLDKGTL